MSVTHNFECLAHGVFEARVQPGRIPKCPYGCSKSFVTLVHLTPPSIGTERVRTATRLVREAADLQGLSDIDVSPSRPGDSVADRNWKRAGHTAVAQAVPAGQFLKALTHGSNELVKAGFGNPYNPHEWTEGKDGVRRHVASPPRELLPINEDGVSMQRMREKP